MKKVRHLLGISGGKDSAALAIYMKKNYPDLDIEYYTCDTGKELDETYELIRNLEIFLGKKIIKLTGTNNSNEDPFDHFLKMYGGYLPSSNARWCTKKLKLDPFEEFVKDDLVISYVGIRGDEEREGYISKKSSQEQHVYTLQHPYYYAFYLLLPRASSLFLGSYFQSYFPL